MKENTATLAEAFSVRQFEAKDHEPVLALWPAAIMHLQPGSDTLSDTLDVLINSIEGAIAGKDHLWVAEAAGRIIGAVAVIRINASLAHLRCLCVAADFAERHVVARGLAEMAITDAWERGYLKLVVHTHSPPDRLAAPFRDLGFEFARERSTGGQHVLEFYQNLYERPRG